MYWDWNTQQLATSDVYSNFPSAFDEAAINARHIHFNLEGVEGNVITFAETLGNNGTFYPRDPENSVITAIELQRIRKFGLCYKTSFYENGSTTPSNTAWANICNSR
jgi:hypothetical protein